MSQRTTRKVRTYLPHCVDVPTSGFAFCPCRIRRSLTPCIVGAAVVLQKSIREGFGLTVTEAMWKGTPVVGSRAGGIKTQIEDGVNGFLVDNIEQAAERIVTLLQNRALASRLGQKAKETVRNRCLMTRLMEDWLDLIGPFEPNFRLRGAPAT